MSSIDQRDSQHLMFEPTCLRSGRCSRVEKGGGVKCPSRLPLQLFSMIYNVLHCRNRHSHMDRKIYRRGFGELISFHMLQDPATQLPVEGRQPVIRHIYQPLCFTSEMPRASEIGLANIAKHAFRYGVWAPLGIQATTSALSHLSTGFHSSRTPPRVKNQHHRVNLFLLISVHP